VGVFGWLRRREERRLSEYQARAGLVSGLVSRYYDGDPIDEYPEPEWSSDVELVEFDGESFQGSEAVVKRLSDRAEWAKARFGGRGSWTIQPIGKFHVVATRASQWPEPERDPRCLLVYTHTQKIARIRELQDADAAHRALRENGVWTHPY
jgi:hypothetical protein